MPHPRLPQSLGGCIIAIVGAGRVGTSLALALRAKGATVGAFTSRTPLGRERAERHLGFPSAVTLADVVHSGANVYFLTVPDGALPEVAQALSIALSKEAAHESLAGTAVIHTSGATPVSVLQPCSALGATTLSFHPLQTVSDPVTGSERLRDTSIAITRGAGDGWELGELLAKAVGGIPFLLEESNRVLYHAAACVASNYLITMEHVAEQLFQKAGLPETEALAAFLPLVEGAVANLAREGAIAALTGPLSRGDAETIGAHLKALAESAPEHLPLYQLMGIYTLEIVRQRAEIPPADIDNLENLLSTAKPQGGTHEWQ